MRRLTLLALCACGLGGGSGGGSDNLPVSGVGPYRKLFDADFSTPVEEPFVVSELGFDVSDPSPVARDGGVIRVFFTRGGNEIWRSDIASLKTLAEPAVVSLAPAEAWEAGAVRAPAVVGSGNSLVMFYQGGPASIGRAVSSDGGATWTRTGMVLSDATSPGAVIAGDTTYLYFTRPSRPGIFVAVASGGGAFTAEEAPVLEAGPGETIGDPQGSGGLTVAGALHVGLFLAKVRGGVSSLVYAGSDDGLTFAFRPAAIVDANAPGEGAPGALLYATHDVLFFTQEHSGKTAIAAATAP